MMSHQLCEEDVVELEFPYEVGEVREVNVVCGKEEEEEERGDGKETKI